MDSTKASEPAGTGGASRLAWTLDILVQLSDDAVEKHVIRPGTRISFEGKLEAATYVYLVQLDETRYVTVLYPADGASVQVAAGDPVRVPAEGWARTVTTGVVRVIGSPVPISRAEIAALADGREPPPATDKPGNS